MPNYIKYSTTTPSGSLKKGNAALGITDEVTGPTSTTGWYSGINPPTGSYTVYEVAATGDPDIYCPINTTELLNLVKSKGATGGNTGSVAAALAWIATQNNLLATNEVYPNIVTSGSVLMLDAGFVGSYPTTASTWYDISGNNNSGSLINGPTFNSNGYIGFDGVDDYVNIPGNATNNFQPTNSFTINAIFKPIGIGSPTSVTDNTSVVLGSGLAIGSYGIGLNYNQIAGTYNLRIGCRSTDNTFLTTDSSITLNKVYDVSLTYQTNGIQYIYVNGVQINSQSTVAFSSKSLTPSTTYGFNIFRNYPVPGGNGRYGIGYFYKGLIYNRALSQTEILQNYYQAPIVTNGLVLALDAGNIVSYESGSTTTYSLTGSVSGSLLNGVGYLPSYGGAWNFDGVDDRIFTNTNLSISSSFTIEYAVLIKELPTSGEYNYVFQNGVGYQNNGVYAEFGDGPFFSICTVNSSSAAGAVYLSNPQSNVVYYATATYENRTLKGYINGNLVSTNSLNFDPVNGSNNTLNIGAYGPFVIPFWRFYNKSLSATEVTQNFNAQKSRFGF
jgi:hypothetical protein